MESSTKTSKSSFGFVPKDAPFESTEASEGNLLAIAMLEERMRGIFLDFIADHKVTVHEDQERALTAFRSHVDQMVKLLVQRELQVLRIQWRSQISSMKSTADGDRVHVVCTEISILCTVLNFVLLTPENGCHVQKKLCDWY